MRALLVGDVHLRRDSGERTSDSLARVIARREAERVIFVGDLFDLAAESVHEPFAPAIESVLRHHAALRRALGEFVERDGRVTVIAGNHDDELATQQGLDAFQSAIGLAGAQRERVDASPWFVRLGGGRHVHVEHGHSYDPDNALPHPLTPPNAASTSLGIGLMRRYIAPLGVHDLVHANDRSPLEILTEVYKKFSSRAPDVVFRYIATAVGEVFRASRAHPRVEADRRAADAVADFSQSADVDLEVVRQIAELRATPTVSSATDTFFRLYLDRVFAVIGALGAGASLMVGGPGKKLGAASLGILLVSILARVNRYGGRVHDALERAADDLRRVTGADTVVMGHAHRATEREGYVNTGSFGFPSGSDGRPYLLVDERGVVSRRHAALHIAGQ